MELKQLLSWSEARLHACIPELGPYYRLAEKLNDLRKQRDARLLTQGGDKQAEKYRYAVLLARSDCRTQSDCFVRVSAFLCLSV